MTRDQLINWFVLDGWEPIAGRHDAYLRGVRKDGVFVCLNVFVPSATVRILHVVEPRESVQWDIFSDTHLQVIAERIWRMRR